MASISEQLVGLRQKQTVLNSAYTPIFFRLDNAEEKMKFVEFISDKRTVVCDFIIDQIKELVKCRHSKTKLLGEELEVRARAHLKGANIDEYGVWVYYPWSGRMVHILDEPEFVEVRTSRNQYKISPVEREVLAQKKIGVIGLSVGQSVSVTLAMERICGELRLADFDLLELTNLNRIRTGLHNLGLAKVYSVAREIAEIDPFIKVVCYPEGLNETNMIDFFTHGGKLDLLVEESDGFDIKILSRYMARDLGIPVVMEGSDRCTVDVERFDLEPTRRILHGLVEHLDVNVLKTLKTNEEKIPYMMDMLGLETASSRLKASMMEIEQSIGTWPQLASSVTMGGGITADVSRRLLLNQYTESGRYHVDIEELIGNKKPMTSPTKLGTRIIGFELRDLYAKISGSNIESQNYVSREDIEKIVEAGCKAPSGGNFQPWKWVYKSGKLFLWNGYDIGETFLGYDNLSSCLALGAAIENVCLQAAEIGLESHYDFFPDPHLKNLVTVFEFIKSKGPLNANQKRAEMIHRRLTNRKLSGRSTIDKQILDQLSLAVHEIDGADLALFNGEDQLNRIADVLGEIEKIRLLDEQGHKEFVEEIRWTETENSLTRDGVDIRTLDLSNAEMVGLQMARDAKVIDHLREWGGGGAFKKMVKKSVDSASAVGIITMPWNDQLNFLKGGMAVERLWLEANLHRVSVQPLSVSVFLYARLFAGKGLGLSAQTSLKLQELRKEFETTFGLRDDRKEIFIFRLCIASEPEVKSLRKPLNEVFAYSKD